jgi:hypothetical protein
MLLLERFISKSVFKFDTSSFKVGQKTQNFTGNFFAKRMWFCGEKNSNSVRDGQNVGCLFQPVQLFLDQGLLMKGPFFSPNPRSEIGFCRKKIYEFWPGQQKLWSLGSASNQRPKRSQVSKCFVPVKHQKIK